MFCTQSALMRFVLSQNKQRFVTYIVLTDCFNNVTECVYCAVRAKYLKTIQFKLLFAELLARRH